MKLLHLRCYDAATPNWYRQATSISYISKITSNGLFREPLASEAKCYQGADRLPTTKRVLAVMAATVGLVCAASGSHAQPTDKADQISAATSVTELRVATPAPAAATIGGTSPIPKSPYTTWHGITLYGTLDLGFGYESHGEPLSTSFGPGLNNLISKGSNRAGWSFDPNALSYSSFGVRGQEEILPGLAAVFNLQTSFLPTSIELSNGLAALAKNNGVPIARQTASADSSREGQLLNAVAFFGLSSRFGTLTYGRQNSFDLDGVVAYDPLFASNAFSVIGWQGGTAGGGDTESARLDSTLKYLVNVGPVRAGVLYQLKDAAGKGRRYQRGGDGALQFDLGADIGALSVDAIYSKVDDALAISSLTAAQAAIAPADALAATASDNTSIMLLAKYRIGPVKLFAGYENIRFANPSIPVAVGAYDYGYQLGAVNNTAYINNKLFQVVWTGARYSVTRKISIDAAYYHEHQSSYSATRCSDASLVSCSGNLDAISVMADYKVIRYFDIYAGAMLSMVNNGLASGFLNKSDVDPTIGGRFAF